MPVETNNSDGDHNVASLHESIAGLVPDRDAIVDGRRHLSWAEVADRTRRLAAVLNDAGIGMAASGEVEPWESPHDHVALYLYNGHQYLEGMLGAWKARACAVNINYRYVTAELVHVLSDCRAAAVIVDHRFAATLTEALPHLPQLKLILQVGAGHGAGAASLPGAVPYESALAAARPEPPVGLSPDDRYIVYTGGTTGRPKGVLWRQADFLATCLGVRGTAEQIVETAASSGGRLRTLPSAPLMHGAAHWNAISAFMAGGTVVIPEDPTRLDAADVLATCQREQVTALQIVGDAFARPLLEELARTPYDLSSLRFLLSGGAVLSAHVKRAWEEAVPGLRIIDVLGSSETGRQALAGTGTPTFSPAERTTVLTPARDGCLDPDSDEIGWLAQQGRVPLGYLGDPEKTRATFPVIDGVRHAVAGDRVRWAAGGHIELLGRDSAVINTGGEKVFAEEVEQVLTSHPGVADALVVGHPDPRWGQQVTAVVMPAPGDRSAAASGRPTDDQLRDHCRGTLAGYKLPRAVVWVDEVRRSPSGKPDYAWAREVAAQAAHDAG